MNFLYQNDVKQSKNNADDEADCRNNYACLLYTSYINSVKVNLRSQLNNINIQNEDGSVTNLGKKNAE